jgi:anti-sigma factor RsiW
MGEAAPRLSEAELADLCALADGTLPAERRAAVEARIASSPELQELLERQRQAVAAAGVLADEPVPPSLQAAVEARRRGRGASRLRGRRMLVPVAAAGAVAAVAIAAAVALLVTGNPSAPTVADAARFSVQAPSEPAPRSAGDGTTLAVDVEGVSFPDFAESYGWRAVGARTGRIDGRDVTTVVYERDGRRIAYTVVGGSALPRPSPAEATTIEGVVYHTLRVNGRLVVTWRRLGHTCVLTGAAPRAELVALASWRGDGTLPA